MGFDSLEKIQVDLYRKSVIFLLVLILGISTILFLPFYFEHKEKREKEIDLLINSKEKRVEQFFERLKITTDLISNRTNILLLFEAYRKSGDIGKNEIESLNRQLFDSLKTSDMIYSILVADKSGRIIGTVGRSLPKEFLSEIYVSSTKTTHFTIYKNEENPIIITVSPIFDAKGLVDGYGIVVYKADILHEIIANYEGFGGAGESMLGHIVENRFNPLYILRDDKKIEIELDKESWDGLLFKNLLIEQKRDEGRFLLKAREIDNTNLVLLVSIDKSEFYHIADNHYSRLLLVAFLFLLFGLLAIRYLSSKSLEKIRSEIRLRMKFQNELEGYKNELEIKVKEEVEKRRQNEQLLMEQSKMAAVGEMIGFITHQWRQPITALSMLADVHRDNFEEGKLNKNTIDSYCDSVHAQLTYLNQTISDFREFFKPSRTKIKFSLLESLKDVRRLIEPKTKVMYVNIEIVCEKDISISGFPNEFKQVILNLINNGIDAINKKREIESKKNYDYEGKIVILCFKREEGVVILLSDNGTGIDEEIIPKLFCAHFSTKGKDGSGIGLYMSKLILKETLEAKIEAQNSSDGGAEFVITIPCKSS